jgi:hypothetical protein
MALSDSEKAQVIDALERIDDASRVLIIASIEAFTEWLSTALYSVYLKVKDALTRLWNWICSQF